MSQKDIHYYATAALAVKAGFEQHEAELVAWSDQYTDELTKAELHGMRTQCGKTDDWYDRTVQADVLVPFHFLPGDKPEIHPWMVTPNSKLAQMIVHEAVNSSSLIRLGIALHSLQDTFTHQGFTGWQEQFNACYWFSILPIPLPNVGHTDMGILPDIVTAEWTDPRIDRRIVNITRCKQSMIQTYKWLCKFNNSTFDEVWLAEELRDFWRKRRADSMMVKRSYDERKQWLIDWTGGKVQRYWGKVKDEMKFHFEDSFVRSAREQLSLVTSLVADLPAVKK